MLVKLSGPLGINLPLLRLLCWWGEHCERLEEPEIERDGTASVCVPGTCQGVLSLRFCGSAGMMPCARDCVSQSVFSAVGDSASLPGENSVENQILQKSLKIKGN